MTTTQLPAVEPVRPQSPPKSARRWSPTKATRPAWEEPPSAAGQTAKAVVLAFVLLVVLIPLYAIVLTSFSTDDTIARSGGLVMLPDDLTLAAYLTLFNGGVVTRAALVSIGVTAVGTVVSTMLTALCAYGLSRPSSYGHRPILMTLLVTMFFGAGMIPVYLVVSGLGLIDSWWSLILPGAVSAFNVLIMRSFFMGIEPGLLDAARIDGAGDWRIFLTIVMPISKAVTAVVSLFYAVGYWNAFFNAMLYLNDNTKWPLQLVLRAYVLQGVALPGASTDQTAAMAGVESASLSIKMAVVVLAVVPVVIVYPFVQRHFVKGVIVGAIKG
ncbi:carbohydrate ABC transporter permease [Actinomycetes bacterium KLBMP 9759]